MSYLDTPRLSFHGKIMADPSTINNDRENFSSDAPKESWNEPGKHHCIFKDVEIFSVTTEQGVDTELDLSIGVKVETPPAPVPGKMVDIDPVRQRRTALFGVRIGFQASDGTMLLQGDLEFAHLRDLWGGRRPSGSRLFDYGGVFSCELINLEWNIVGSHNDSAFGKLKSLSPEKLAFHFTMCGYQANSDHPDFAHCDVSGVVGPIFDQDIGGQGVCSQLAGLMPHPDGRQGLVPTGSNVPLQLNKDEGNIVLDLSNAIPEGIDGNTLIGQVDIGYLDNAYSFHVLKSIPYSNGQYKGTCGVESISLDAAELDSIRDEITALNIQGNIYLDLNKGLNIQANQVAFRMEPSSEVEVAILVSDDSVPLKNVVIEASLVSFDDSDCLSFQHSVLSDDFGKATLRIDAARPTNFPVFPNGATQKILLKIVQDGRTATLDLDITVLKGAEYIEFPTWENVRELFESYHYLYPVMQYLKLNEHETFQDAAMRARLQNVMQLSKDNPLHMPVTRDISDEWLKIIFRWFELGAP